MADLEKAVKVDSFDSKKMLEENVKKGTKIKYTDRMQIEITSDNMQFYKKGKVYNPAKVKALALIEQKLAKKYVPKETE